MNETFLGEFEFYHHLIDVYHEFKIWYDTEQHKLSKGKKESSRILEENPFIDDVVKNNSVFKILKSS